MLLCLTLGTATFQCSFSSKSLYVSSVNLVKMNPNLFAIEKLRQIIVLSVKYITNYTEAVKYRNVDRNIAFFYVHGKV